MDIECWAVTWIQEGRGHRGELRADEEGLHLWSSGAGGQEQLFIDYLDLEQVSAAGGQLQLRHLDAQEHEQLILLSPAAAESQRAADAEVIRSRIESLVGEYTEPAEEEDEQQKGDGDAPGSEEEAQNPADAAAELQFDQAEFEQTEAREPATCAVCSQVFEETYFEINGQVACPDCKRQVEAELSPAGAGGRFLRALCLGTLAAVLGAGIYFGIAALTGYEIGLVAVLVGFLVGGGVRIGARNRGGWGYQTLAILLTYAAIVATYVPPIVRGFEDEAQKQAAEASGVSSGAGQTASATAVSDTSPSASADNGPAGERPVLVKGAVFWIFVIVLAVIWPFAALFFEGLGQVIGLLIVGFAVYEAWRLNKRLKITITGPYQLKPRGLAEPAPAHE
jgi:hypothetical protein